MQFSELLQIISNFFDYVLCFCHTRRLVPSAEEVKKASQTFLHLGLILQSPKEMCEKPFRAHRILVTPTSVEMFFSFTF